jgi:hypothetical protein
LIRLFSGHVVIGVATKFKEHHTTDAMIAIPRMSFGDRLPAAMRGFLASKSVMLDIVDDLEQQKRQASHADIDHEEFWAEQISEQS